MARKSARVPKTTAYGDEVGFDLWSVAHVDERAQADAPVQWASFASEANPGHVKIGSIIKAAVDAGFEFGAVSQSTGPAEIRDRELETGAVGDVWNGQIFARMFRDKLLHIHETGDWLLFSPEQGWVTAPPGEVEQAAKKVLRRLQAYAAEQYKVKGHDDSGVKKLLQHITRTSDLKHQRAMIELAKSEPGMTRRLSDFDSDPMLLGVMNGVLDLRTRTLMPMAPNVLVSKRCNVAFDPAAKCPVFNRFLQEVQLANRRSAPKLLKQRANGSPLWKIASHASSNPSPPRCSGTGSH